MSKTNFESMIGNYLTHERNILRNRAFHLRLDSLSSISQSTTTDDIPEDDPGGINGGDPFTGNGSFHSSLSTNVTAITNVLFRGETNSTTGAIASGFAFSFSGVHGTITSVGSLIQSVHNGVTTYKQYFEETVSLINGAVSTQQFLIYGNIYEGKATVNAMDVPPPPIN